MQSENALGKSQVLKEALFISYHVSWTKHSY